MNAHKLGSLIGKNNNSSNELKDMIEQILFRIQQSTRTRRAEFERRLSERNVEKENLNEIKNKLDQIKNKLTTTNQSNNEENLNEIKNKLDQIKNKIERPSNGLLNIITNEIGEISIKLDQISDSDQGSAARGACDEIDEITNKLKQISNNIDTVKNKIEKYTSHIITFDNEKTMVLLPIKMCEGCEMALIEFKTLGNVNRGTINVYANNLINTYHNGEESKYIYSFYHKGGRIKQKPPALIYFPITEEYGSFINVKSLYDSGQEIELNSVFFLYFILKNIHKKLSTVALVPVSVVLGGVSAGCGVASVIVTKLNKKFKHKQDKHRDIYNLCENKLNTINSILSKALENGFISDEEFDLILKEEKRFREMKESIQSQRMIVKDNKEITESIINFVRKFR